MKRQLTAIALLLAIGVVSGKGAQAVEGQVSVTSPLYCSDISGDTPIDVLAPGFKTVTVNCWKPGQGFGEDSVVGEVNLDDPGKGSVVFHADQYPHGPLTVRISGQAGAQPNNCYLQLYNKGGVSANAGIPKETPPGAKDMRLVFADDFDGPLSISSTDPKARYYDHKPPNGSQDFSTIRFTSYDSPNNPFSQVDTYLRIRADANKNSSGILSSAKNNGTGILAKAPCYFECRFLAPNAIGTWPAFWLLTNNNLTSPNGNVPVDELDIIEACGGEGPQEPNATADPKQGDLYQITPHAWNQGKEGEKICTQAYKDMHDPINMSKFGVPSSWFETFHTYGCKITETDTIYYLDNIEVGRHKTMPNSKKSNFYFLINLATGGGWPVDLSRYNGLADMYVDYVRVYQGDN